MNRRQWPRYCKLVLVAGLLFGAAAPPFALAQSTTDTYEYDALGRLVRVDNSTSGDRAGYDYDAAGNRIAVAIGEFANFSIDDVVRTEGNNFVFTVTKSGATTVSHNVSYATANVSASAGSDYTAKSGTLTFTSSETTKTVSVTTADDSVYEAIETFNLNLSSPTNGATITDSQGVGTLYDNDPAPIPVRNVAGVVQSGFHDVITDVPGFFTIYETYETSSSQLIYLNADIGFCVTSTTLTTGYSWTGNGCEMVKN